MNPPSPNTSTTKSQRRREKIKAMAKDFNCSGESQLITTMLTAWEYGGATCVVDELSYLLDCARKTTT